MYGYGLDHGELGEHFLELTYMRSEMVMSPPLGLESDTGLPLLDSLVRK